MQEPAGTAIKVAGALSGVVFISSLGASVAELKQEISRLLGGEGNCVKLISAGRSLQDDTKTLAEYGITSSSKVLVMRSAAAGSAAVDAAAEKAKRLDKIRKVVDKLSRRDASSSDQFAFTLENQAGDKLALKEEDQRALVMALALHDSGRTALEQDDYEAALERFLMAEEAAAAVDPALLSGIDNIAMLLLDIVWCCYKMGDLRRLAVSRERLVTARGYLAKAHGSGLERVRRLHGAFCPELATYVRLEALEGVVAYHLQDNAAAAASLATAQRKWRALQVSDDALAALRGMGYKQKESLRALRFAGGDVGQAVTFIQDQHIQDEERKVRRRRDRAWHDERARYGKTAAGKWVEVERLEQLTGMGYERAVAAEGLRRSENAIDAALELLNAPTQRKSLQMAVALAQSLRQASSAPDDSSADATDATSSSAAAATLAAGLAAALASAQPAMHPGGSGKRKASSSCEATGGNTGRMGDDEISAEDEAAIAAAATAADGDAEMAGGGEGEGAENEEAQTLSDAEVEESLIGSVRADPMAAYDLDVTEEGELVQMYLALLSSSTFGNSSSNSGDATRGSIGGASGS